MPQQRNTMLAPWLNRHILARQVHPHVHNVTCKSWLPYRINEHQLAFGDNTMPRGRLPKVDNVRQ